MTMKGIKHTAEAKRKISAAFKDYHYMRGKHWPDHVCEKIRLSNTGQKRSEETKNISLGLALSWRIKKG
jgi:hypothetical protein